MTNKPPKTDVIITNRSTVEGINRLFFPNNATGLAIDATSFSSSYAPAIMHNNWRHPYDWYHAVESYPTGLTLIEQYGPQGNNVIIFNNGSINIESVMNGRGTSNVNVTVISCEGDITINRNIKNMSGRFENITLMAPKGTITFNSVSDDCLVEANRLMIFAEKIVNHGKLCSHSQAVFSGEITNNGVIHVDNTGPIITQQEITGSGQIQGQQLKNNNSSNTLKITGIDTSTSAPRYSYENNESSATLSFGSGVDSNGASINDQGLQFVTLQNIVLDYTTTISQNLLLVTPGTCAISSDFLARGKNLTILANKITTQNIDVSGSDIIRDGGKITLISMSTIQTGDMKADYTPLALDGTLCANKRGGQVFDDYTGAMLGQRPDCSEANAQDAPSNVYAGAVTLIATGPITTKNVTSQCLAKGGNGGAVLNCDGSDGTAGKKGTNCQGSCGDGGPGYTGGFGGAGGDGGRGGNGCSVGHGGQIVFITGGLIHTQNIHATVDCSGGNGGLASDNTGGHGGNGGDGGDGCGGIPGICSGHHGAQGPAGSGGDGGRGGNGGNGGNACGSNLLLISCTSISTSDLSTQTITNGGNGGDVFACYGGYPGQSTTYNASTGFEGNSGCSGRGGNGGRVDGGILACIAPTITTGHLATSTSASGGKVGFAGPGQVLLSDGRTETIPMNHTTFLLSSNSITTSDFQISINTPSSACMYSNVLISDAKSTVSGTAYWLGNSSVFVPPILLTNPSMMGNYPFWNVFLPDPNTINVISQEIDFESLDIINFAAPTTMCAESIKDVSFAINAQNGSGMTRAVLAMSDQVVKSSDFVTTGEHGKIFWCYDSADKNIFVADYNPQVSDRPYNVRSVFSPDYGGIRSLYIDQSKCEIYTIMRQHLYYGSIVLGRTPVVSSLRSIEMNPDLTSITLNNNFLYTFENYTLENRHQLYVQTLSDTNSGRVGINKKLLANLTGDNNTGDLVLDITYQRLYWVTGNKTIGSGKIDNLNNPSSLSQITQITVGMGSDRITGVFVDSSTGAIYWLNDSNGGELWQGMINDRNNPTQIVNLKYVQQLLGYNRNICGLFMIFDPIPQRTLSFTAPSVGGRYPLTLTVYDSDLRSCSDIKTTMISVSSLQLVHTNVPTTILAGSDFTVSFSAIIQDPDNLNPTYTGRIQFANFDTTNTYSNSNQPSSKLTAPCTAGSYKLIVSVASLNSACSGTEHMITSDFLITVLPLTVQVVVSNSSINPGESVVLNVSDPLPSATYRWTPGNLSGYTQHVTPSTTTLYTVTATSGNCHVSDSVTVHVSTTIALSDISISSDSVRTGSSFNVTCTPKIQNGSDKARITMALNGQNLVTQEVAINTPNTFTFPAPCVMTQITSPLTITATDPSNTSTTTSTTQNVTIFPLGTQVTPSQSDVLFGTHVTIRVVDPVPGVTYNWSTGAMNTTSIIVSDSGIYTVTGINGLCSDLAQSTITTRAPQHCVTLSDITLSFASNKLTVAGYQKSLVLGPREIIVSISKRVGSFYNRISITSDLFLADGHFLLICSSSQSLTANSTTYKVDLTASVPHNPGCLPTTFSSDFLVKLNSTSFAIHYIGSLFSLVVHFPPDLYLTDSSDINTIFYEICSFAQQQPFHRFLAGFEILVNSDVLNPNSASLLVPLETVYISCDDDAFCIEDTDGLFALCLDAFGSDTVTLKSSDANTGTTTKTLTRTGHEISYYDNDILWVSPCEDAIPYLDIDGLIDNSLLEVNTRSAPITQIESIGCIQPHDRITSDATYVCHLCKCALRMDDYLAQHYPNYSDLAPECSYVTYTGEIVANTLSIDLENCMICFSDYRIPDCSDPICF